MYLSIDIFLKILGICCITSFTGMFIGSDVRTETDNDASA